MSLPSFRHQFNERQGRCAENFVQTFFEEQQWKLWGKRIRTPEGELDLVMITPENIMIIIEVKARKNYIQGVESISKKQQQRIIRGTLYLKSQQPQLPEACRFDVAIVTPEKIWHVENAWSCDGGY